MSTPLESVRKSDRTDVLQTLLKQFLSPAPIKILRELNERGRVYKSELMEGNKATIRWGTYTEYEEPFLEAGLIEIEKESTFPFRQYIIVSEKGKEVLVCLDQIERLILTESDRKRQVLQ